MKAFLFSCLIVWPAFAAEAVKPNVVVFLADDAGWGDFSQSGNPQVSTPMIDSIATEGVSLDRFFVCPVCSPTRAEFLTGRYYPRGGVRGVSTGQERLNLDEKTIADAFKASGYATGAFGKWHNGSQWPYHPMARGFDEFFGYTSGHWGEYFDAPLEENGRMIKTSGYIVDLCTNRALDFIAKHKEQPFFCYIPFTTPHSPWAAPKSDWQRFKNKKITALATNPDKENLDKTRCALAMVENQDWNVGRVLKKLDELDLRKNTIVLYFSDNGPNGARWNGGMKGVKGSTDEGGVRSVCYVRWPDKLSVGKSSDRICAAIDLLPTLLSLTGVEGVGDKPLDGIDLTPLLTGTATDWPDRMLFSKWARNVSVRTQTHRLDGAGRLYDMLADPGQTTPVNEKEPALASELIRATEAWKEEVFSEAHSNGRQVGSRPLPAGYREFPITMLPARDGKPHGGVRRSGNAPNSSYFVNWKDKEGYMTWDLEVHTTGRYKVSIDYTCIVADAGSEIELSFRDSSLKGKVQPGWDPTLHTNQDTLPRGTGESRMKDFRTLELGEILLQSGRGDLTLRALDIPGNSVMDVRRVTLTLVK